jgi:PAS domain S-box-containing protein
MIQVQDIPVKLLLVDDLEENLLALEALLRKPQVELLKARGGREALELLLAHDVALALIDVQMPELDGFELAELMRGTERTKSVPIIFVTAGARESHRIFQGYDAGAVDFLFKPIDAHILRHKVDTFVELHRQRQQLAAQVEVIRASEEFRRRIIESSQDLIAVLDLTGNVLSLNTKGQQVFGGESHDGAVRWTALWESDEAERCLGLARAGDSARFQGRGVFAELRDRYWDVVITPMRDARGRVEKVLAVARDVTQLHRLNEELADTLRLNETFVAAVGHDLRTPLNSIVLSTELLLGAGGDDPAKQRRVVERLRTSAFRMSKMIDELFDLARARLSGGIPIEPEDGVDISQVAEKIASELAATEPGRSFELQRMGDTRGRWDGDRIGQVLSNLLGNALRHGSSDGPIELVLDGSRPDELLVTVSNRGQIPDDVIACLFEPFRRSKARAGSTEGLGLGLFIVQQIVQAHGGDIGARSQEGVTTFRIVLPRKCDAVKQPLSV